MLFRSRPWDSLGKNTGVGCYFLLQCMKVKSESEVAQSCPTLSDSRDCSPPGSTIHGIFQARVLEWGAIAFSGSFMINSFKRRTRGSGAWGARHGRTEEKTCQTRGELFLFQGQKGDPGLSPGKAHDGAKVGFQGPQRSGKRRSGR